MLWCTWCNVLLSNRESYHDPKMIERVLESDGLAQVMQERSSLSLCASGNVDAGDLCRRRSHRRAREGAHRRRERRLARPREALSRARAAGPVEAGRLERRRARRAVPRNRRSRLVRSRERRKARTGAPSHRAIVRRQRRSHRDALQLRRARRCSPRSSAQKATPYSFALDGDVLLTVSSTGVSQPHGVHEEAIGVDSGRVHR